MARSKAPKREVRKAPRRVLIADDHIDSGLTLQSILVALGYAVRLVEDGEAAVRLALTFKPEIVILDIGMPKLSGYDAAHLIRKSAPGSRLLIVALSGWGRPEDIAKSMAAGFDAHLVKPLDLARLLELINAR